MKNYMSSFSQAMKASCLKRKLKVTDEDEGHTSRNVLIGWNSKKKKPDRIITHTRISSENQISIKSTPYAIYICSCHFLFPVNSRRSFIVHGATRSLIFPVPRNRRDFTEGGKINKENWRDFTKYR